MMNNTQKVLDWRIRCLTNYLVLNDTALHRKGLGLSYAREDILTAETAKAHRIELKRVKEKLKKARNT